MKKNLSLDSHKLLFHLDKLNAWRRGEMIFPIYVAISPSGTCNYKCVFCAYDYLQNQSVFLEKERIFALLEEFKSLGVKAIFYSGEGEPLMNKSLPEIIEKTRLCGIDCALNTNGILFTEKISVKILKHLTFVRISLNAGTEESYAKIHSTSAKNFERVLDNISRMVETKKRNNLEVTIGIQCLLLEENQFELVALAQRLKKLEVDYLAIKPFLAHPKISYTCRYEIIRKEFLRRTKELEELSDDKFKVIVRKESFEKVGKRSYNQCLSLPFMIEIDCTGDIYPCGPYLGQKEMIYGNIYKNNFKEIWKSEQCKKVMEYMSQKLDVHECMPNCRNDAVNAFLWNLVHPPMHVNFI